MNGKTQLEWDSKYHTQVPCVRVQTSSWFQVLATAADPNLGGRDFDNLIANHFTEEFRQRYKIDAKSRPRAWVRLINECEKLKKRMSSNSMEMPLNIECFMEDKDVTGKMGRETMEGLAIELLQRIENTMKAVLQYSSRHTAISILFGGGGQGCLI